MHDRTDAIAAIATPPGRGAVGIVRVSGQVLGTVVQAVCGRALRPREATYLPFLDAHGQAIDHGLAIFFPAPHSFTGEDVLELQAHGGPVVLQLLLARCLQAGGAAQPSLAIRLARPGEFTERAFLNDKLDLAQAEAVADLIDASTEAAARSATRALAGAFSREVDQLQAQLIALRMRVEAHIDFPEEGLEGLALAQIQQPLQQAAGFLASLRQRSQQGALLRAGIKVVLAGQPNVGKSSLLNALAGAELAIVSPIAGTTRDKVAQSIQIEGVPVHVVDTAGLRHLAQVADGVEKIGIERAWAEVASADVVIFLRDASRTTAEQGATEYRALDADLQMAIAQKVPRNVPVLQVWNKADLLATLPAEMSAAKAGRADAAALWLSAQTGQGLQALRQRLLQLAGWESAREDAFTARGRHLEALSRTQQHVSAALLEAGQVSPALELLAEELRLAQLALAAITGAFSADDLLGEIFSKFCIGK
jgi:tRNA modification GTPase